MDKETIKSILLAHGFTIKPGETDLKPYVYKAAFELLEIAAPDVQGEPVAVVDADDDGMWADILPNVTVKVGQTLYTAPQPAEQQPDPTDMQILAITTAYEQGVGKGQEALCRGEEIQNPYSSSWGCDKAWQLGYEEGKEQAVKPRPVPDVTALVEALECALETMENVDGANDCSRGIDAVEEALAAHRKGGDI